MKAARTRVVKPAFVVDLPHMPEEGRFDVILETLESCIQRNISTNACLAIALRAQKKPIKHIARTLKLSPKTVREHIARHAPYLRSETASTTLPKGGHHYARQKEHQRNRRRRS